MYSQVDDCICGPDDVSSLGTILSIWAHPDDETYFCGGLMACARDHSQRVVCVTATRGEAGSQDPKKWPLKSLSQVRTKEMEAALKILGVQEHHWLDYPDGGCADVDPRDAVKRLVDLIQSVKPDTVLTFGKEGITGHADHQAVCKWSHAALKKAHHKAQVFHPVIEADHYHSHLQPTEEKVHMFFAIDQPPTKAACDCDIQLALSDDLKQRKREALQAMPSQTANLLEEFGAEFIDEAWSIETMMRCSG